MQPQSDVGAAANGTVGLTPDREQEIYDGRGAPPTEAELEAFKASQVAWEQAVPALLQQAQRAAVWAMAASEIVGCGTHEVTKRHGKRFGKLTPRDIVEQGRRGLRGRRALDSALVQRVRSHRAQGRKSGLRPRAADRTPRRARRVASRATPARGSPRLADDDEPEPRKAVSRHSTISCALEVDLLFVDASSGDLKRAGCAYCGSRTRGVRDAVLAWFHTHPCGSVFPADVHAALARRNREKIRAQGGHVFEAAA